MPLLSGVGRVDAPLLLALAATEVRMSDETTRNAAIRSELVEALERIAAQQPKTLAMIERNGFAFDSIGREPGNWQHLAFSIYTDLCEVDTIARTALEADRRAA